MKLLAIHSNKLFFKKGAPNFYGWLCEQRGLSEPYRELEKIYDKGSHGPAVLADTYHLAVGGLTAVEFKRYAELYIRKYQIEKITEEFKTISQKFKVMIFTSLPRKLFCNFFDIVYRVFGAEYHEEKSKLKAFCHKITHLSNINIAGGKNERAICRQFDELGLSDRYVHGIGEMGSLTAFDERLSIEPNRYGLLAYLINEMIELGVDKKDVIVVGTGRTAKPMHKVAGRVVESLDEL